MTEGMTGTVKTNGRVFQRNEMGRWCDWNPGLGEWVWWLECKWLPGHRWTPQDVHPLLVRQESRGTGFMTTENVLRVMDAKDPEALVLQWLGEQEGSDRRADVSSRHRRCMAPGCREARAGTGPAARWCAKHAADRKQQANREAQRRFRKRPRTPRAAG